MYKATAKAEQFQGRVANESTKGSRKGYLLDAGGEDPLKELTPEEQRASLSAVVTGLQKQIMEAKAAKQFNRAKKIGQTINAVNLQIHAIRPHRKSSDPQTIAQFFMDVCRESLPKTQFHLLVAEANRRQRLVMGLEQPVKLSNG